MSRIVENTTISTERVKQYLNSLVNSDIIAEVSKLNESCKDYRLFKYQLKHGVVHDLDEDKNRIKIAVEKLDENGEKIYKTKGSGKKATEVPVIGEKVSTHEMTAEERKFREEYINSFESTFVDIKKKIKSYNEHKIKFPKLTIKVLNSKMQEIAVNYLIAGYNHAKNVHLTMKASKETAKKVSSKPKIKLSHMVSCDYNAVSGIKMFLGKAFSEAQKKTFDETLQIATAQARTEAIEKLKEEGYVEGKELKERKAAIRQLEKKKKEEEELKLYGNMTLKEIKAAKEELKKATKADKKEVKNTEKKSIAEKYMFANAIKRSFKEHDEIKGHTKLFSVSFEVMDFIEQQCVEFLHHIASYAVAVCKFNNTKTFRLEDLAAFMIGHSSNHVSISSTFTLENVMVPSESAYEKALAENKAYAEKHKTEPAKVDRNKLPKESAYAANATFNYSGAFSSLYTQYSEIIAEVERQRKKAKEERDAKEKSKSVTQVEEEEKTNKEKVTKKVLPVEDSDSEEEEEAPQVVKKVVKKKH